MSTTTAITTIGSALPAAGTGLALGFAVIAAIGPQNAFVLREGLRGQHIRVVISLCVASDMVLISAVVAGAGLLVDAAPWTLAMLRWLGACYLAVFAILALRRALRPRVLDVDGVGGVALRSTVLTTLALTWLNPHVYVDTVLILGPLAASHGANRWAFGLGVIVASTSWFVGVGLAARLLRPLFARPITWRLLDAAIAATMGALAIALMRG
jgi:L-lysine exporter family protein LysE/ArgO